MLKEKKWAVALCILLITIIWGYAWIPMKASLQYMGPFTFSAFRFGTGAVTLLFILLVRRMVVPEKGQWKHFIIVGLLQTSFVFLLVMYGLRFVDAGKSSMILYSMPIWSSLLAAIFLNEKLMKVKLFSLGLGMIGLLLILGWDVWIDQNPHVIFGECLIVLGAVSWGFSNVYYRKYLKDANNLQVTTYQMLFGSIGIALVALVAEWGDPLILTPVSIYYILYTGVLASSVCFTLWFILLTVIDTATASISILLVPVFGLLFGWLLLDEKLTLGVMLGSLLIIIGIVTAQLSLKKNDEDTS